MNHWTVALGIFAVFIAAGLFMRFVLIFRLERIFSRTRTRLDDLFLNAVKPHFLLWFLLLGIYWAFPAVQQQLPARVLDMSGKAILILFLISVSFAVSSFITGFIRIYAARPSVALPTTSLTENLARILVFGLGTLLILSNLGISITPLLTALGVGSLAVALALQDTLSDLFAGIYIIVNDQINVGDYVKFDSGQEGYVEDIGWKTVKIRELSNNIVIIPNSKVSKSILTNYYLPEKEMSVVFQFGVAYGSDLNKVEKVTIETAKKVLQETIGGVAEFEPFIRYHTFDQSSINLSVILRVKEYTDRYLTTHVFIKQLHECFQREGITIPFPQKEIWIHSSKSGKMD